MSDDEVLDAAAEFAFGELDSHDRLMHELPSTLQTFIRVMTAQGVIDNGGVQFLFECDFDGQPDYQTFVNAYECIGAIDSSKALSRAIALFRFADPHKFAERRRATLELLWEDDTSEISDLDDKLCGDESVWEQLTEFVNHNRRAFGLT